MLKFMTSCAHLQCALIDGGRQCYPSSGHPAAGCLQTTKHHNEQHSQQGWKDLGVPNLVRLTRETKPHLVREAAVKLKTS